MTQGLIIPAELIIKTDKNILEQERPGINITRRTNHGPHIPPVFLLIMQDVLIILHHPW